MTTSVHVDAPAGAGDRQRKLAAAVARIRRRARGFPPDRWLPVAGGVLVPLGIACIGLGWYGAAHTTRLYQQVPYVLSGGVLGVALVFAGGFAYFAAWMTRLVHQGRAESDRLAELLEQERAQSARMADSLVRIETLLEAGLEAGARARGSRATTARASANGASLVATPNGTLVHRPDCPIVAGKRDLRSVDPSTPGYRPCKVCEPELAAV